MIRQILLLLILNSVTVKAQTQETAGDTSHSNWKKILVYHSFEVTKDKNALPLGILKKIGFDSISEIANPKQKWNAGCVGNDEPRAKLNWAAYIPGKTAWAISVTRGGYSANTIYYLVTEDQVESIRNPGWNGENFKNFKKKYLAGTLKKGALY